MTTNRALPRNRFLEAWLLFCFLGEAYLVQKEVLVLGYAQPLSSSSSFSSQRQLQRWRLWLPLPRKSTRSSNEELVNDANDDKDRIGKMASNELMPSASALPPKEQTKLDHDCSFSSNTSDQRQEQQIQELKDYSSEAAALFGNVRIPSALFAGAAAGAAFALPIQGANEGVKLGMIKRVYALLMMGALSCEVTALVVSTLVISSLSTRTLQQQLSQRSTSLRQYLLDYYDLEWITARLHFFFGVLFFLLAVGLRAWITINCYVIAQTALGIILSSLCLCMSFWKRLADDRRNALSFHQQEDNVGGGLSSNLPVRYWSGILRQALRSPLFLAYLVLAAVTTGFLASNVNLFYHKFGKTL